MGASDYVSVQGPDYARYANPNFGLKLGEMLGQLPDAYMQGRQMRRTLELQKPILDPNTGEPSTDTGTVSKELLRRGGGEYAKDMLPFLQRQPIYDKILRENDEGGYEAP